MKTKPFSPAPLMVALVSPVIFTLSSTASASDIPDRPEQRLSGIYKVTSSSDPLFPLNAKQEWFLDFGTGKKLSGSVSVSLRQNPNVRVRIMAWQFFPEQSTFALGNPYAEGSRQAVARGVWTVNTSAKGLVLERGSYQLVMTRPAPGDY